MLIVISYIKINNNIFNNGENVHWKKYYKKAKKKKEKKIINSPNSNMRMSKITLQCIKKINKELIEFISN